MLTAQVEENIAITDVKVSAYTIPTETPESDGTLEWDRTTMVLVEVSAGGATGIGYTYAHQSAGVLIDTVLREVVTGMNCFNIPAAFSAMVAAVRNQGNSGITYMAISAVDCALWDLKAKLLDISLAQLIGQQRDGMPVYGSGGFTSYSLYELQEQLSGWVDDGINRVKMKVGRKPEKDPERVKTAREAIGDGPELFVDANGAYSEKQAIVKAHQFAEHGVSWFEEPVSSDNLAELHYVKENTPPEQIEITAGEYGYNLFDFKNMLEAEAVDVLQADLTRCGGITGFLKAGTLCEAHLLPFSAHCAPSLHLHVAPAMTNFRHAEYFYDHVRIERMLFDGFQEPENGVMKPDLSKPGFGLTFKHQDAEEFEI